MEKRKLTLKQLADGGLIKKCPACGKRGVYHKYRTGTKDCYIHSGELQEFGSLLCFIKVTKSCLVEKES